MDENNPLASLLEDELKDIYDAEKQLTKALPKLAKQATSEDLREAIQGHLQETQGHVERLEQVFEQLGLPARAKKCVGMQNLLKEGNEMIGEAEDDDSRDAVMIASAQKVEHYEIASYGSVRTWASLLGHSEAVALLEETLEEEKAADRKLTSIAESFVNAAAAQEDDAEGSRRRGRQGVRGLRAQAADSRGRKRTRRSR